MDLLRRELAPIAAEGWREIDEEARRVLELNLGARKLVDFDGPHGWDHAAVNTGRVELLDGDRNGVCRGLRKVLPLAELRIPVRLKIMELDCAARGAQDADLDALVEAAEAIARGEDEAIFRGDDELQIVGIEQASVHDPVELGKNPTDYPHAVVEAVRVLRNDGVNGPYGLALGDRAFDQLKRASEDGYPISRRVSGILSGPVVRSPALDGAVVMSVRGGDFILTTGSDMAIGYACHDKDEVELYLTETFTFRVLEPAAAVSLKHA